MAEAGFADLQRRRQRLRLAVRGGFFALFLLAPPLDLLRLDLHLGHLILFGHPWTLGLAEFVSGETGSMGAALALLLRGFLPIVVVVGGVLWVSWRYGRLYCGWLCPHFSVVETINGLMRRASGRPTLWERRSLPATRPDGRRIEPRRVWWLATALAVVGFAFLWAVALLTYLLPPAEVYGNLWNGTLTRNQAIFLGVATFLFVIEFTLARHLFCRFACAAGLFQSLIWMANRRALVVGFDRARAGTCASCDTACEHACPMRLKPRAIKRRMFTCTQCAQCLEACAQTQSGNPRGPLLQWVGGACALDVSERDFGRRPDVSPGCFPQTPPAPARWEPPTAKMERS